MGLPVYRKGVKGFPPATRGLPRVAVTVARLEIEAYR